MDHETEKKPLGDLCEEVTGGLARNKRYVDDEEGEPMPVINVGDISGSSLPSTEELDTWSIRKGTDPSGYQVKVDDILIPSRGFSSGVARVPSEASGAIATSNLAIVRPPTSSIALLIFAYLTSPRGQYEIESKGKSSTGRFSLTLKDLKRLEIPLPPREEREELAEIVRLAEEQYQTGLKMIERTRDIAHAVVRERMQ